MPLAQPQTTPVVNTQQGGTSQDWRVAVLQAGGWPVTKQNLALLAVWQRAEGGSTNNAARFNYLNLSTSGAAAGYPSFTSSNGTHIAIFPSLEEGARQTAAFIKNGRYPVIDAGLKSGNPLSPAIQSGVVGDLSTWVSGSRTGNQSYGKTIVGGANLVASGGGGGLGSTLGGIGKSLLDINPALGPYGLVPGGLPGDIPGFIPGADTANKVISAAEAPGEAIKWVAGNWDRALEVLGGSVLVIIGVILLGAKLGLTPAPAKLTKLAGGAALSRYEAGDPQAAPPARRGVRRGKMGGFDADPKPAPRPRSSVESDIPF